jgi:hypothetical protein
MHADKIDEPGGKWEAFMKSSGSLPRRPETQSLPDAHGVPVGLAHHSIPAPGRLTVVRDCVALDTLDQVGSLASLSGYCCSRVSKCSVTSWANC